MKLALTISLITTLAAGTASAVWTEWTPGSGGNGHFYQVVASPAGINWYDAQTQAQASGGYLATITAAAENNFVYSLFASDAQFWGVVGGGTRGPWIGAVQPPGSPEPGGGWTWVTGEPFSFQNWEVFEPNNYFDEDRIHYYGDGVGNFANRWNDLNGFDGTFSFVIERIPEPGTGALSALALAAFAYRRIRRGGVPAAR